MNLQLNANRFTGENYVNLYNHYRPEPPQALLQQCLNYLGQHKAGLLVDLGCGTGISTRVWSAYSNKIIGIEPSAAMLSIAQRHTPESHISYQQGYSHQLDLPSNSADIVTCSQSFHWMEPHSTLKEIDRILKHRGVLLIYDVIWPPSVDFEYEQAYNQLFEKVNKITATLDTPIAHRWDKKAHLKNVRESQYFDYVKEAYYHKQEKFSKEKFVGIALSQGGLEALLKRGYSEDEVGLTEFKEWIASNDCKTVSLTYNYRVVFGIKNNHQF